MRTLPWSLLILLAASPAAADRVQSPPDDCPPGSMPHTEHAGPWCDATPCTTDAECVERLRYNHDPATLRCRPAALCVVEERYQLGHLTREPEYATRWRALGRCIEGACPGEGECRRESTCIVSDLPSGEPSTDDTPPSQGRAADDSPGASPPDDEPDPDDGGGGCAASAPAREGGLALFGLAVAVAILRARERDRA